MAAALVLWATTLLPVLHSLNHRNDHTHGPGGVQHRVLSSKEQPGRHAHDHHRGHQHGGHQHDGQKAHGHAHGHAHDHHTREGHAQGERAHHGDHAGGDSPLAATSADPSSEDSDDAPPEEGPHGEDALEHFGAALAPSLPPCLTPPLILGRMTVLAPRLHDDRHAQRLGDATRCRGPPMG